MQQVVKGFVEIAAAFKRLFSGRGTVKDSEIVLNYLKKQIAGFDRDPYQHAYNAGKTRMLRIIEEMTDDEQYKKHVDYLQGIEKRNVNNNEKGK